MNSKQKQILAINKRKDLTRQEKTDLIQKIYTPAPDVIEDEKPLNVVEYDFYDNLACIQHLDKADLENAEFSAVACHVTPLPQGIDDNDFCAFTRQKLNKYKSVASILVSRLTPQDYRSGGKFAPPTWVQLCNGRAKGELDNCHFFNVDMLCQWIKEKGCVYIECPMCRRGARKRKAIREEEIETMAQLQQERDQFLADHDFAMAVFKGQQIVEKACREYWDERNNRQRKVDNQQALQTVLENWIQHREYTQYRDWLYIQAKECIKSGNTKILSMLMQHYVNIQKRPVDNFSECLQICCEQNNPECMKICLEHGAEESQFCLALLACAQNKNELMFKRVADRMAEQQAHAGLDASHFFISPELFKAILKWDNVEPLRTIFNNRWKSRLEPQEIELVRAVDAHNILVYLDQSGRLDNNLDVDDFEEEVLALDGEPPILTRDMSWGDDVAMDDEDDSW